MQALEDKQIVLKLYNDKSDESGLQHIPNHMFEDLNLAELNDETRLAIQEIGENLDIYSSLSILEFGKQATEEFTEFSSHILESFSSRDIPDIMELMPTMEGAFNQISKKALMPKQGFLRSLLGDKSMTTSEFIDKYNSAADVVNKVKDRLNQIDFELTRDIEIDREFGFEVLKMVRNLEYHIIAAKLKLRELQQAKSSNDAITQQDKTSLDIYFSDEIQSNIERLDRKIYNLTVQKVEAMQTIPIIAQIIKGSEGLSEQIKTAISQGIPTWEKSILIAVHLYRQQSAIKSEQALRDMTNNLIKQNASMLKENCENIAVAVERGLIDIEALQSANDTILESAKSLGNIVRSGEADRKQQLNKLKEIQHNLLKELKGA